MPPALGADNGVDTGTSAGTRRRITTTKLGAKARRTSCVEEVELKCLEFSSSRLDLKPIKDHMRRHGTPMPIIPIAVSTITSSSSRSSVCAYICPPEIWIWMPSPSTPAGSRSVRPRPSR
ncbi:hypothetical protein ACLOJK_040517 [Asimina triloba]